MNFPVTSSPHIRGNDTIRRTMIDVMLALVPALLASSFLLGFRYLGVAVVSMAAAVAAEWLFCRTCKKPSTVGDCSAAVTGLLLSLTLPATIPYWMAALGAVFAIVVVKGFFGGLGQNLFNPALSARAFLLLLFPASLVRYAAPGQNLSLFGTVDAIVSATPLHHMQMPALPNHTLWEMLMGNSGGSLNELLLLLGGAYLVWRKVITIRIPAAYLGSLALLTLVFHKGDDPVAWMLYSLLSGGVILGAIFMATDYVTSPVTPRGQILYGMGCGVLTVVFRYVGLYPEGVTYAILLMNATVWLMERITPPRRFGEEKGRGGMKLKNILFSLAAILLCGAVVRGVNCGLGGMALERRQAADLKLMQALVQGETFTPEAYSGGDENIRAVWKSETGYLIESGVYGYADDVVLWVGVDLDGAVTGIVVRSLHETYGLGGEALHNVPFLAQYIGTTGGLSVGENVDALTGATVTSKAITKAVNSACAFVTGADVDSSATEWGEW